MDKNESRALESYRTSWIVALFANIAADVDWRIPVGVVVGQGVRGKERRGEGGRKKTESVGVGRPERRRLGRATSTLIGFYS